MLGRAEHAHERRTRRAEGGREGGRPSDGDQRRSRYSSPGSPRRSHSPSSTDLETIDFIPAFAPEEGEVASDYQGGARRTRCGTKNKMQDLVWDRHDAPHQE